ncbi:hypothetical protein [Candidatus Frankia alpina]|uniref:hypothetical protein n=1 Tax=Candidatus Frankia alpina TaxID=2699483 RepID=UPI00267EFAA0
MRIRCANSPDTLGLRRPKVTLAGVQVSGLDRYGLDLWRVDGAGAEQVRVTFRQPLIEPRSLGRELRRLLDQSTNTSE